MTTSWQLSRGTDLDWQYHRVEQLHRNVSLNAKKTRLILEEFEAGVKDSVTELKYVSEAQFRIIAPILEDKLLEALKMQKTIQQLVEQSMVLQATTELSPQTEVNVHSRRSSYSATPAGVYTPAHTPYTGMTSVTDRDPRLNTFGQTPEGMAPFPLNISSILNSAISLQTPLSMNHHGNNTEVQNLDNTQSLGSNIIPRCNLNSTGNDIHSPEYFSLKLGHNGSIETPGESNRNNFDMNKNHSNDAYIDIPDDIFVESPITPGDNPLCKNLSQEFVTANNTVASDVFYTPKCETNQENTKKETVIEIEPNDMHSNDQNNDLIACKSMIVDQGVQTCSTKRKRESTCNTPIKDGVTKVDYLQASKNVIATNSTLSYKQNDPPNDVNIIDGLASFQVGSESDDVNNELKDNILNNSKECLDSVEAQHTTEYKNNYGKTDLHEDPIDQRETNETKSLEQVSSFVSNDISNVTEDNSFNSNTNLSHEEVGGETCNIQEDYFLHSAQIPDVTSINTNPLPDVDIKTGHSTSLEDKVIDCENVIYAITRVPPTIPPLEQYTKCYVTHFEAPNQVWVQLEDCGIEDFQYELNCAVTQNRASVPEEFITKDNLVVAPFGGTTDFYRAKVDRIVIRNEETCVAVNFLDYGNSEIVNISSLVMMPESVMNASCKAIPCIFDKIDGADLSTCSNVDDLFYQLVNNTPFYAYIRSYDADSVEMAQECEKSELPKSRPRYVTSLSKVYINEAGAATTYMESHIAESVNTDMSLAESVNEAELDISQGISSSDSSYASYNGRENKSSLNQDNGSQLKLANNPENCEFSQQNEYNIYHTIEDSEGIQMPKPDMSDNGNFLQKNSSSETSNVDEWKAISEVNAANRKLMTSDLPTEDENEYILQVIGGTEKTSIKNANINETKLQFDSVREPMPKMFTDNKAASKIVSKPETNVSSYNGERASLITDSTEYALNAEWKVVNKASSKIVSKPESNVSTYSGKWSSLITDSSEYALNAEGRVVNFNSNESCAQLYSSSKQKSCRKRQITGNASVSQKSQPVDQNLIDERIFRNAIKGLSSGNKQKDDKRNNDKSMFTLPVPLERKCQNSDETNIPDSSSIGSSSECFVPVEVLPSVKLEKQSVTIGAEEQIQVLVSHVDSPNSFFLHLINSETASIERFNENMTEHYKKDGDYLKVERLPVGSFWAVRWKDNCWYRAQILASISKKTKEELLLNVRFVDHGDSGVVSIKDVRVLAELFTFVPMLALPCTLAQVSPLNEWEDNPWTQQSIEGFVDLIGNFSSVLKGNFISYALNGHYDVVLENQCGVINEMMVDLGLAKSSKLQRIIGQQVCPPLVIHEDADNKTDNASDAPIVDDFGIQLKGIMKQSTNVSSVMETSIQITPDSSKDGPVSAKLLKNSNIFFPTLPSNINTLVLSEKIDSVKKTMPANNINDEKCERGFIRKLCNNYGFIEHFGFQNSLFFHYSEFYGDIDFLDIGDIVEFEILFDEFRCKPMAQRVARIMSYQEQLVGFVNEEILEGVDNNQCINYMDGERFLYIPFDKDDIEGYVLLKPRDKVSFSIKFDANSGKLMATNISLEGMTERRNEYAGSCDSFMDCQSQDTRWDPMSESYSNGYNYQTDECAETLISGRQNTDLSRLCKFYRVDGKCPRGVTCRYEHKLLNKGHTVEKEPVFMDLIEEPNLPKEESVVAMIVTYVESPSMFYCYLPHGVSDLRQGSGRDSGIGLPNSNESLHELLKSMCNHYRHSLPTPNRSLPAVGELRAAPLANEEGDLEWWRVRILDISEDELDNCKVKVLFLDYGEVKWIKELDLRPLDIQFIHMPAQALECWLYDVKTPNSGWPTAAKNFFIDLTKDRMLVGLISHCDQSIQRLGVKLYDTTEDEININDVMINSQQN